VPFFGFSFDVNDLGILGGTAFLVILGCFRFFISREVDNLKMSFEEARRLGKLRDFYHILAMKQVFTAPQTQHNKPKLFLRFTPKFICWLPLLVYIAVTSNDLGTAAIGDMLERGRYRLLITVETITLISLFTLSWMVTKRLLQLDHLWNQYWPEASGETDQQSNEQALTIKSSSLTATRST
jgi:hypothetical protein